MALDGNAIVDARDTEAEEEQLPSVDVARSDGVSLTGGVVPDADVLAKENESPPTHETAAAAASPRRDTMADEEVVVKENQPPPTDKTTGANDASLASDTVASEKAPAGESGSKQLRKPRGGAAAVQAAAKRAERADSGAGKRTGEGVQDGLEEWLGENGN